jgi:glycosyltransferase involved in cell wall biosynthesis
MACGTPVIVFEGTALPDVIKAPLGGLAVPAKDSRALAVAIKQLLENDELRCKLGKQARQIAEREYSFSQYVKRHISLYDKAIEQHQ